MPIDYLVNNNESSSKVNNTGKEITTFDTHTGRPETSGASVSLFNAFYVFKYSGGTDQVNPSTYISNNKDSRNGAQPETISNPTASAIVDWARSIPANAKKGDPGVQNSPYSWSDFLFCKWYGIVPNNRLITLRKYPLASRDDASLNVKGEDTNLEVQNIPVAQAVTWFGGPTGNELNKLWQNTWSIPWLRKGVDLKEVAGNEITNFSEALLRLLPDDMNASLKAVIKNISVQVDAITSSTQPERVLNSVGKAVIEEKQQAFLKTLWSENGAFWNQIQGPVNVKNQFLIRDRGLSNAAPDAQWEIVFEYRTDSYFGMNQRRVGLDILANMINLTYSDGDWLQSLNVYYKKVGLAISPDEQILIENALNDGGIDAGKLTEAFVSLAKTRAKGILDQSINLAKQGAAFTVDAAKTLFSGKTDVMTTLKNLKDNLEQDPKYKALLNALEIEAIKALADSFPAFLQQRAAVADINTGNWHLTVGNPMNPILRIGNLIVRECKLDFGEELGPDDFPIEMKFTVKLSPSKPRDGQDLRRTFNNGRADFINNFEGHTWDKANTYGKQNNGYQQWAQGIEIKDGAKTNFPKSKSNNERVNAAASWIVNRYGAGMVDLSVFEKIYFYQPPQEEEQGGSGTPKVTNVPKVTGG